MMIEPVKTPCSMYDQGLSRVSDNLDELRKSILWRNNAEPVCDPDGYIQMTWSQVDKLFANIQSLLTELHFAEIERVRKIMERI